MTVPNTSAGQDCAEMVHPALQSGVLCCEKNSCTCLARTLPFPLLAYKSPIKLPCWWPFRENVCSRAWTHTSLFFDQRRKISCASGLNSVLFYCLEQHQAGGPFGGPNSSRLVTNFGNPDGLFHQHLSTKVWTCPCFSRRTVEALKVWVRIDSVLWGHSDEAEQQQPSSKYNPAMQYLGVVPVQYRSQSSLDQAPLRRSHCGITGSLKLKIIHVCCCLLLPSHGARCSGMVGPMEKREPRWCHLLSGQ